jgi:hypothetical protein
MDFDMQALKGDKFSGLYRISRQPIASDPSVISDRLG